MKKFIHFPLTRILVGVIVCVVIPIAIQEFIVKPLLIQLPFDKPARKNFQWLMAGAMMLFLYYVLFTRYEKREITELSPKHFLKDSGLSVLAAILLVSFIVLLLSLLGYYSAIFTQPVSMLFVPILAMSFLAISEELVIRGIIYRITEESLGTHLALLISSLIFGAAHLSNEHASLFTGFAVALEGGVFGCLLYSLTGRLWAPIFFHLGWNYTQFFYGTNVSGLDAFTYFLQGKLEGPELLTGGKFGIENSLITVMLYLMLSVLLYAWIQKQGTLKKPFWMRQKES